MQKSDARSSSAAGEAKLHFLDYWRVIRVRFGIVVLSFLLVLITAGITTYFMPKKYRSSVTVELRMPNSDPRLFKDLSGSNPSIDAGYSATQFEIIQRKEILYPVVDSQDLPKRWATDGVPATREQCYWKLRGMLTLKPIRTTQLLDISVTSTSAPEAALLVNAVVQSYEEALKSQYTDIAGVADEAIEKDLVAQRKRVDELNGKLLKMQQANPLLNDLNMSRSAGMSEDPRAAQIAAKEAEVNKSQTVVAALQSQLDQVARLKGEELMRALATLEISDPTVQKILPQYQEAVSSEAGLLNSGLGQNHPKIKSLRAAKEVFVKQLDEQIDSIKHSLAIRLEIAQKTLQSVTNQLEAARKDQTSLRVTSVEYNQLKDEYLRSRAVLDSALANQSIRKIDVNGGVRRPIFIWDRAEEAKVPSSPNVYLNMILGVLVGAIVGVGLAFFIEYLDTSVKTMDDVEAMLGVPVLAIVPKNIKLLHRQTADVPDAEAYRILRTNIEFNRKSADANTVSMVSGGPGEGKSTTLCNLAFICAQGGYSVLIVDADLRRPTQHKLFEVSNTVGLTNYLTTNVTLEDVIMNTSVENLYLMPSGILPSDAVGILNSQRMSDMIAELKTRFDIIFFDSPPILGVSDGAVLASEVDQSIIIVQHRRFPRSMLQRVKQSITNVGGTVLGVVLNNVDLRHDPNYAYYTSYYEYYTNRNAETDGGVARPSRERAAAPAGAGAEGPSDPSSY